jgi:hypothetical protein
MLVALRQLPLRALGLASLALAGCDGPPGPFEPCPLSQSILNVCAEDAEGTVITCVVESHPMCTDGICASWEGSEPFCSNPCDTDADCPSGSACLDYLALSFCVPEASITPAP